MHLHCDGTYKIIWQGHTLIVTGTTDRAKQWHQLGVCISQNEKASDYEFVFNGLKKAVLDATGKEYRPNCLVADAAGAITRGFQRAFSYESIDDYSRVVCWQHVKRACLQRILSVQRELRESLKADLYVLQASQSRLLFAVAVKLFLSKWENEEKSQTFLTYFKKQWLDEKRTGWYQGYLAWIPDHNNNNESDNRWIKEGNAR